VTTSTKRAIQVYLRPEQLDALRLLSTKQGTSMAELIRQGVDLLLTGIPVEDDPLWNIIGLGNSGVHDLALKHDRYLAEIEEADNQQHGQ
jgi:hypothetical protein